jgi:hypothetical protein
VIPELTNRAFAPVVPDAPAVFVAPGVLRLASLSLVGGAAALWASTHGGALMGYFQTQHFIGGPILFAVVAAALPVQLLAVTRPLVKEVMEGSTAPAALKLTAALAVSAGSVLTAVAWWHAFWEMAQIVA